MTKLPRVAVLLAACNGMNFIEIQINSILAQRNVDLLIFISIDKSSDDTERYLASWALIESRLRLLPLGHIFGGAAANFYRLLRDVNLIGFDYISFADQDDIWHHEKLCRAHQLMIEKNKVGYSSNFTAFWSNGVIRHINKAKPQRDWDFLFESAGPGCTYVLHINLALPLQQMVRNAGDRLLLVDYHDWLTYAFARSNNFPWVIDSWSSMQYRQHEHNQIGVNSGWLSFWKRVKKIISGYGFKQSLLIAEFVNASSLPIVYRGLRNGRSGYLWLALFANQCRRRFVDRILFFISCVLVALLKPFGRG